MMTFGTYVQGYFYLQPRKELTLAVNPAEVVDALEPLLLVSPCLVGSIMEIWDEYNCRGFDDEATPVQLTPALRKAIDETC